MINKLNKIDSRRDINTLYTTLEDFERVDSSLKRILVIGATGAGKSTLLNILAGYKLLSNNNNLCWASNPPFESGNSTDSVTSKTCFINAAWFGDLDKKCILIDTPGYDDTHGCDLDNSEYIISLVADIHNKIKAIKNIHTILVIHNDVWSNRINPVTYTILKMIESKFAQTDNSIWNNVIVAYSKCNDVDVTWKNNIDIKKRNLLEELKRIFKHDIDIPILTLSGVNNDCASTAEFDKLWDFVDKSIEVETKQLQPFYGVHEKFKDIINKKDKAEAELNAYKDWIGVVSKITAITTFLFWRSWLTPWWFQTMMLNIPGPIDEIMYILMLIQLIGPTKVLMSFNILHKDYTKPFINNTFIPAVKSKVTNIIKNKQD